jgi:uncharacterized protein (DUF1330 family)
VAAYVIASLTIKDPVRFEEYRRTLLPSMRKYGARLVARGGPIVLEGEWPREKVIIAEFPSMEQARGGGARQNTPSPRRCAKPRRTRNWLLSRACSRRPKAKR